MLIRNTEIWGWYKGSRKLPSKPVFWLVFVCLFCYVFGFFQEINFSEHTSALYSFWKEDVNKYAGKEMTLPARVSGAQKLSHHTTSCPPSSGRTNSAKAEWLSGSARGALRGTRGELGSPLTPWADWEVSCGRCGGLMEVEAPASSNPCRPKPGTHGAASADGSRNLRNSIPGISHNQSLVFWLFFQ